MASIKGTQTEQNLLKAFAGESQARNRYTYFASVAKKEGYEQIAAIFTETADNEKEHAKVFFKYLEGGDARDHGHLPGRHDRRHRREPAGRGRRREDGVERALPRLRRRSPRRRASRQSRSRSARSPRSRRTTRTATPACSTT